MKEGLQLGGFHNHKLIFSQNKDPIDRIARYGSSVENKVFWTKKITWENLQIDIEFLDQKNKFPKDYFLWIFKHFKNK